MKALSLWQPWASAMATGAKRVETRSWSTNYRGDLAIHAAKRRRVGELLYYSACWNWCGALNVPMGAANLVNGLPFGAIVAVVDLRDCRPTEQLTVVELDDCRIRDAPRIITAREDTLNAYRWTERQMGNFGPGRYGWITGELRRLASPVPCRGYQQLFNLPPDVERAVREQMEAAA